VCTSAATANEEVVQSMAAVFHNDFTIFLQQFFSRDLKKLMLLSGVPPKGLFFAIFGAT
jgi:hypothetical protein